MITCATIFARLGQLREPLDRRGSPKSFATPSPISSGGSISFSASATSSLLAGLRPAPTPATGESVEFSGVNIFRFGDDGKVVELWNHRDDLGLMEQVGAPIFAGAPPADPS